jgi:hypothetical protein
MSTAAQTKHNVEEIYLLEVASVAEVSLIPIYPSLQITCSARMAVPIHVRKSTRPEPRQQEIYSVLGVKSHPGQTIKTT